jgi:enamine deaminase RidA (YjgF/YER057c/UK114 family)
VDVAPSTSERLSALGIVLPPPPKPAGAYAPVVRSGPLAWVSGQIAVEEGRVVSPGRVDGEVSVPVAQGLARRAMLQALSALADRLGTLDAIRRPVRVVVYVATSPGFDRMHVVANGATELLVELFGEEGRPARSAVGVAGLPLNAAVEVELAVETREP